MMQVVQAPKRNALVSGQNGGWCSRGTAQGVPLFARRSKNHKRLKT